MSYDNTNQMLFCSVCLVYSSEDSKFRTGFNDWKRIKEHESSNHHNLSVKAHIREKQEKVLNKLCVMFTWKKGKLKYMKGVVADN